MGRAAGRGGARPARPRHERRLAPPSTDRLLSPSSRCVKDTTYRSYQPPSPNVARFGFNSFSFLTRFPSVYLRCKVVVCRAYDQQSRCRRGCVMRSKRDVGSYQEKVDVVLGPIQLQKPHAEKRSLGRWLPSLPLPTGPQARDVQGCGCFCWGRVPP